MSISDTVIEDVDSDCIWPEAVEEDPVEISSSVSLRFDSTFWSGNFLPPPPRPPYLEDQILSDGLTTCDLCSWALEHYSESKLQSTVNGFTFSNNLIATLTIVSVLSALLGAVIMIVLLNCKSRFGTTGSHRIFFYLNRRRYNQSEIHIPNNSISLQSKEVEEHPPGLPKIKPSWLILNRTRKTTPVQLLNSSVNSVPATNHYTVEEAYTSINEAVYTEVDRIPSPVYQNSGYMIEMDNDPISSAPSSAYYSDISAQGTYEIVGQTALWDSDLRQFRRLSNLRHIQLNDNSSNSNYI